MPQEVYEKWGFGMAPPKDRTQQERMDATAYTLAVIDGFHSPSTELAKLDQLSIVKGLFNRIYREDQWDWFTVRAQLGYPLLEHLG